MNDTQPIAQPAPNDAGANLDFMASLGDLHQTLWRRKWYVLASLVATLVLGAVYLVFAEPLYIAQARVVIERKELPLQGKQYHGGPEFFATQVEVMRSPQVLRGVMQSLGLPKPAGETPESFSKILHTAIHSVTQYLNSAPPVDRELAAMSTMLQSLTVNPVLGTNVLNVGYRNADPDQAARVVHALITEYMNYAQTLDRESHAETLRLLRTNEDHLRAEAASLDAQYQAMHKQSPLLGQGKDSSSVQHDVLLHLGQKLTETMNHRIDLENTLYALRSRPTAMPRPAAAAQTPPAKEQAQVPQPLDASDLFRTAIHRTVLHDGGQAEPASDGATPMPGDLVKIQDALWKARIQEGDLAQTYGPKHPERIAARTAIAMWENVLREAGEASTKALEQELTAAKLNESRLTDLYRAEFDKTKALDDYVMNEQRMADDLHRVQAMHESTRTELRQWELDDKVLTAGKGGVTVQVIDDPSNSLPRKLWPRSILVLAACLAFGFVGGAGIASVVEYRSRNNSMA